ncbi:hypothetical protein D9M71_468350 [compost metagenome]
MTEVHCTGHVDYKPKQTTDFDYEMDIDNDGEIRPVERDTEGGLISVLYLSQRDIESMVSLVKGFENGSQN